MKKNYSIGLTFFPILKNVICKVGGNYEKRAKIYLIHFECEKKHLSSHELYFFSSFAHFYVLKLNKYCSTVPFC